MGYTHYWEIDKSFELSDECVSVLRDCCLAFQFVAEAFGSDIQFEYDDAKPWVVTNKFVRFNGLDEQGHETFFFHPTETGFNFCKTARKPYDLLVCACLYIIQYYHPKSIRISSDGRDSDGWANARAWTEIITGFELTRYPWKDTDE
jgi:hypothetical protein